MFRHFPFSVAKDLRAILIALLIKTITVANAVVVVKDNLFGIIIK
jgi:hypothetical protein